MKKIVRKAVVDPNTELTPGLRPDDALKFKLAVATRSLNKKEKSGLFANVIKNQIKKEIK
tara:strand:- start:402 stop:581 length:180 start_codon:yes stop_codon:yes gene_type:complete